MRTTVTIDADTEALLREEAARTGQSFKSVLNQAVKRALGRRSSEVQVLPLFPAPFPAELARESFNRLATEWEDEDTVEELSS
ncbi:MAG: ribbon-helix-helix protein, CopG family [Verrucomicrobiae bacterium]|nr:ribbon-helix-helix protein, CopG family [Verrucomicrobiae bacterium]